MSFLGKVKDKIKKEIAERNEMHKKISLMSDKELKKKAITEGGQYGDAYVKRKQREKELKDRIRGMAK